MAESVDENAAKTEASREDGPPEPKKACLDEDCEPEEQDDKKSGGGSFSKRRKVILLLSYCGKGYMGMQKNPGVSTIEEDLLEAMSKGGAFPPEMKDNLGQLKFQRCARTDKGVSAARQVVSLKYMVYDPDLVPQINAHLPKQIKVFAIMRATKSFDSRHNCSGRSYEYLIPTYAFGPFHLTTMDYRIDDTTAALVERLLRTYVGTHNFHNFTSGKKFSEMSSNRYIISFQCGKKHLAKCSSGDKEGKEVEFLPLRVRGQSFMIHQIRKMIGLVVAVVRKHAQEEIIERAFLSNKVDIPRAPALGLLLDNVHFDGYNRRFGSDGSREPLEWSRYHEEIEQFKRDHIYQTIIDTEVNEMSMMTWLHSLRIHDFTSTATRLLHAASSLHSTQEKTSRDQTDREDPSKEGLTGDKSDIEHSDVEDSRNHSKDGKDSHTAQSEDIPSAQDTQTEQCTEAIDEKG